MWSSRFLPKPVCIALAIGSVALLSACSSFAPVYSSNTVAEAQIELAYAEPASRTEQIIYQELRSTLGESSAPSAPLAKLNVSSSGGRLAMSRSQNPNDAQRLTITAMLTISPRDGMTTQPTTITRTASADFTTNNQVLSNQDSRIDAEDRAARAVAGSLRLAILASLSR